MEIGGRAAIVTGGATGVGRATVLALAERGCSVLVNYSRSSDEAEATAAAARAFGVNAFAYQADVADDGACRRMVDAAVKEFGRVDVLVQSAGTTAFIPALDLDRVDCEHWDRILAVNLRGAFQCARAARHALEASGRGAIVNVSSLSGIRSGGSSIPYSTSKAALNCLTAILANVLAPTIRVNAVAPGFVTGRWLEQGLGPAYAAARKWTEARAPLRAVCDPADVAAAILSLITGSDMITGQVIAVDGGWGLNH